MFGDNSHGFSNETEIINYLNTQNTFDNLNNNFKQFISFLFGYTPNGKLIKAYKPSGQVKPDVAITIDSITKYVSVKKGSGNSVHQENISMFTTFLKSMNIPDNILNDLLLFHYGDGTINGKGTERISACQWIKKYPTKVTSINNFFNKNEVKEAIIERVLFKGNVQNGAYVDAVYHGSIEDGLWASRKEILNLMSKNIIHENTIHISNLNYQVWNRGLNFNPNTENRRHVMQIKWASLYNDLLNIRGKNGNK